MENKLLLFISLASILACILLVNADIQYTNIECKSLDKDFCDFAYCYIKSHNRTYKYLSLRVNLFEKPLRSFTVNLSLLKRANGYKPFLYNITVDGCKLVDNKQYNPVASYLFNFFKEYSNLNHSCPYNHDIIVEKLKTTHINNQMTNILPLPLGSYSLDSYWSAYGKRRIHVKVYADLT